MIPKFKAWDRQDRRMIVDEQEFIPLKITNKGVFRKNAQYIEDFWELMITERFELFQSTGKKDINGREIFYDSEIFRFRRAGIEHIGCIIFDEKAMVVKIRYKHRGDLYQIPYCYPISEHLEVIGTLQENPELFQERI